MYTTALASAPFGVSQNNQFFLPTTNGRIAFSAMLFGNVHLAVEQELIEICFLVPRVDHGVLQLASRSRVKLVQPRLIDVKNRWVKKAQTILWTEIEKRYATLFTNRKGNVAKPLRLALGACIIQAEYGFSDEETALQIQENPFLQYFCGYAG